MKRAFIVLAVIIGAVGLAATLSITAQAQHAKEAETLFHRGVHFEEVRGELKEAIAVYEEIVKKYPEERPVAARAFYHLGVCYEKLGRTQAADAFKTIVEKYPDQAEIALLAKDKLSLLARAEASGEQAEEGLKISLVWQGKGMDSTGEISPDGKYLSCVDWSTSDLAVRDMATGKVRRLTSKEGAPRGSYEAPDASIWSPDSRQIAYNWYGNYPTFVELRIIRLDGTKPRGLYKGDYFRDWVHPSDWSPDGQKILAMFYRGTDYTSPSRELGLVSVTNGTVDYVEAARGLDIGLAKISPDGRYIVFDHAQKTNPANYNLSIIPIGGKALTSVVDHPADDRLLGWAPDGLSALFMSDRTGVWDAWMIEIVDGKPQGPSRMLKRELGMIDPMGVTRSGSLYYSTPGLWWDIFSASIDPDSGRVLEGPQKLRLPYEGRNFKPRLSPDGAHLAYVSQRGRPGDVLSVLSLESGEAHDVPLKGNFRSDLGLRDWLPDGRSILIRAKETGQGAGLFKVDYQTGEAVLLMRDAEFYRRNEQGLPETSNAQLSPDGRSLYYLLQGPDKFCRVMMLRLDSKDLKEICRLPTYDPSDNSTLRLSPDGSRFALLLREGERIRALKVFPAAGGEGREIHRFDQGGRWIIDMAWSPDGRYVYFSRQVDPEKEVGLWGLWRVPAAGGEVQNLKLTGHRIDYLNFHPDGKRIIFHSRTASEQVGAVWMMENFLPNK